MSGTLPLRRVHRRYSQKANVATPARSPKGRKTNWKAVGLVTATMAGGAAIINETGEFDNFWNWLNPIVWSQMVQADDRHQTNVDPGNTTTIPPVIALIPEGSQARNPAATVDAHGVAGHRPGTARIDGNRVIAEGYQIVGRSRIFGEGGGNGYVKLTYELGRRLPLREAIANRWHEFIGALRQL